MMFFAENHASKIFLVDTSAKDNAGKFATVYVIHLKETGNLILKMSKHILLLKESQPFPESVLIKQKHIGNGSNGMLQRQMPQQICIVSLSSQTAQTKQPQ